jgi:hypothetical protein
MEETGQRTPSRRTIMEFKKNPLKYQPKGGEQIFGNISDKK